MDQSCYWNDALLDPSDSETLPTYLFSPREKRMEDLSPQDSEGYVSWTSLDHIADGLQANHCNHDDSRAENRLNAALSSDSGGNPMINSRNFERTSMLSFENVDLNIISNQSDVLQSLPLALNLSQVNQLDADNNDTNADTRGKIAEMPTDHYIPGFFELEHVSSSYSDGRSSSGVGLDLGDGDGGGFGSPIIGKRVACKRKSIERTIGESSDGQNSLLSPESQSGYRHCSSVSCSTTESSIASSSSRYLPVTNSMKEQLNPKLSTIGASSCGSPSSSVAGSAETSQRNCRLRLNPEGHSFIPYANSCPTVSNMTSSSILSRSAQSSALPPFMPPPTYNLACSNFSCMNGISSWRSASSSNSMNSQQRLINSLDITSMTGMSRGDITDHRILVGTNGDNPVHGPSNQNPLNSSMTMPTTSASCSIGINAFPGSIRLHEDASTHNTRNLSESVKSSPLGGPDYECQSSTFYLQHSVQSASQERDQPQGPSAPVRPLHTRHAHSLRRQREGMLGIPLSIGSREDRVRMISEIWNALGLMRRGLNERFEDVIINDHTAFSGRLDLHDRHRDMRLDVDNMSYEDLLALEDRIGYVSTGLAEDTILKNLRQRKHSLCNLDEVASTEHEPCCICREDYCDGEDIGTLGCNHDFHTSCIKQWLMIKNLCPICKTTALVT